MTTRLLTNAQLCPELTTLLLTAQKQVILTTYQIASATARSSAAYADLWHALVTTPQRLKNPIIMLSTPNRRTPAPAGNIVAGRTLQSLGWDVRLLPDLPLLHLKTWLFDTKIAVIGSHNLTEAAMTKNHEASIITDDYNVIAKLTTHLDAILAHHSRRSR